MTQSVSGFAHSEAETLEALDWLTVVSRSNEAGVIADCDTWEALRLIAWGLVKPISRGSLGGYWSTVSRLALTHYQIGTRRAHLGAAMARFRRAYGLPHWDHREPWPTPTIRDWPERDQATWWPGDQRSRHNFLAARAVRAAGRAPRGKRERPENPCGWL